MNDRAPLTSTMNEWTSVRHYYGDIVRIIFVICAVVVGLLAPLSGSVAVGTIIGMPIVLVLVVLAGFTNPHSRSIMILDTIAATLGVLLAEIFAVVSYQSGEMLIFLTFEALSFMLLVALYFSAKNVRAAMMGKIGKIDGVGEFDEDNSA
ncbi:MAG: hypothetical protein KBD06_03605 [Candidatus Pacebacteria bacterium]|nr:hypothetical protein [Candidatus Paceibacterota bacterium]